MGEISAHKAPSAQRSGIALVFPERDQLPAIGPATGRRAAAAHQTSRQPRLHPAPDRIRHRREPGSDIFYEVGDISRFPTVKDFLSYCRLVKGTVASAAKTNGLRRVKLGNPYRRWAFGGATVIAKRDHAVIGPLAQRLEAVPVALLTPLGCQNRTARPTKFPKTLLHA